MTTKFIYLDNYKLKEHYVLVGQIEVFPQELKPGMVLGIDNKLYRINGIEVMGDSRYVGLLCWKIGREEIGGLREGDEGIIFMG